MIVHFIASEIEIVKEVDNLRKIVSVIHEKGHSLARDWVEPTYARRSKSENYHPVEWPSINKESAEAIARADIIIAEVSHENFSVGYQVALAAQQKKVVLMLRQKGLSEDAFVTGVKNTNVELREYDQKNLAGVITDFLDDSTIDTKDLRFNFFIDRQIYNYLRWSSLKNGKTKAEILRELVFKEINKDKDDF